MNCGIIQYLIACCLHPQKHTPSCKHDTALSVWIPNKPRVGFTDMCPGNDVVAGRLLSLGPSFISQHSSREGQVLSPSFPRERAKFYLPASTKEDCLQHPWLEIHQWTDERRGNALPRGNSIQAYNAIGTIYGAPRTVMLLQNRVDIGTSKNGCWELG